jgi:hypothetical protein
VDSYKDVSPRFGIAWDVFGTGRTAVKGSAGKYLAGQGASGVYSATNPAARIPTSATRSWIDADRDYVADCDLRNPVTNGECGPLSNQAFGQAVTTTNYDPGLLNGWGIRPSDWHYSASVQQQLAGRLSVEVAYTRRTFRGANATDNLRTTAADYDSYSITAPLDPRLPGGGGYAISGLLDVVPARFGQVDNLITNSEKFGTYTQYFDGVDVTLNARLRNGLTFQGGTSSGRTVADVCDIRASLPEFSATIGPGNNQSSVSTTSPYCHVNYGMRTQLRGLASYVVPKVDVQLSSVFQSKAGVPLEAEYGVPASVVAQALGRLPSGGQANVPVNLIQPGSMYSDRVNQVDVRAAKLFHFSDRRVMFGVDVYNLMNAGTVLAQNTTFVPGGTWLRPVELMTGRLVRFSAEFNF